MSTVISVENVSKLYRLGEIGTGSIAHDVNRWWHKARGKEDPYLKIGHSNDRTSKGDSDYVYALKDVSFEVKQGEVLGIIGRNGAGKSTLLKILSRVTTPTTGEIKVKGRIASLLEVGTGFHQDLSGRDNIYLNGAILGMRKHEIDRKFDEIVEFSGCERYIDTPVKRYSSGMYVRLAFAVAANLESEILIVDEVLAVGDTEFQMKCLGKMKDVSLSGRTVLFVSHNLAAVRQLTTKSVLFIQGELKSSGMTENILDTYKMLRQKEDLINNLIEEDFISHNSLISANVITSEDLGVHHCGHPCKFVFEFFIQTPSSRLGFSFQILNSLDIPVCHFSLLEESPLRKAKAGTKCRITCNIPELRLYQDNYRIRTYLADCRGNHVFDIKEGLCPFRVSMENKLRPEYSWQPGECIYHEDFEWDVSNIK